MPGLRSRGMGLAPYLISQKVSCQLLFEGFRGMFGGLKGFVYFWGEIENTKPIGSIPMGFVF